MTVATSPVGKARPLVEKGRPLVAAATSPVEKGRLLAAAATSLVEKARLLVAASTSPVEKVRLLAAAAGLAHCGVGLFNKLCQGAGTKPILMKLVQGIYEQPDLSCIWAY